jgi:uroporphyrinogen-III synthase
MTKNRPLQGLGVLITRPEQQSKGLAKLVEAAGGRAIIFPAIEIKATSNQHKALTALKQASSCDWLFFVSANAVHYTAKLLNGDLHRLSQTKIATIGEATRKALLKYNLKVNITPAHSSNSEALLSHPELQNMANKKCMIVRGEGGREKLKQSLEGRGAKIIYAEVYRRDCPTNDTNHLISSWKNGEIDYVTATSGETLKNLVALLGKCNQKLLTETPLLTISSRIEKIARDAGITRVIVSKQPYNETLIDTLIEQTG